MILKLLTKNQKEKLRQFLPRKYRERLSAIRKRGIYQTREGCSSCPLGQEFEMEKFEWENVHAWVLEHKKILIIAAVVVVAITLNYFFGGTPTE